MTTEQLEQRLAKLEVEMSSLRAQLLGSQGQKGWRQAVEEFAGDEGLQEIFAGAMKLREADRKRARNRKSTKRKPKK